MTKLAIMIFVLSMVCKTLAQVEGNPEATGEFRLPGTTKPESYDLLITPILDGFKSTFSGEVKIMIVAVISTDTITLNAKDIDIVKVICSEVFNGQPGMEITVIEQTANPDFDQINIKLESPIAPEGKCMLTISYSGRMRSDEGGFYISSYVEEKVTKWMAVTLLEGAFARTVLPCYDEPAFKAVFNISIAKPKSLTVLSNMPIKEVQSCPDDMEFVQFEPTPLMSVYLITIFVGDYVTKKSNSIVSVFTNKDSLDLTDFAMAEIPKHLKMMEDYTGIPFELPKLNILTISDLNGAMGSWGLCSFGKNLILINDDSTTENKIQSTLSIQNAITHSWFGNLVTCEWWDYLWLNEGFATYFEFFGTGMISNTLLVEELFVTRVFQKALLYDTYPTTHPLNSPIKTSEEINNAIDEVVIYKAAAILRTLKHILTEEIFKLCLRDYLATRKYGATRPKDLFASFDKVLKENNKKFPSGQTVEDYMGGWVDIAGYPVLVVQEDVSKNTITVTQRQYLDRTIIDEMSNWWIIGVSYATEACPDFTYSPPTSWLMRETTITVPPKTGWHIFNIQSISYCRVLYSHINYAALTAQLKRDFKVIHVINRAQLLFDAFEFALTSVLHYPIALDLSRYLVSEDSFTPFDSILDSMKDIANYLQRDKVGHPKIRDYFGSLTGSLFNKLETLVSSGNTDLNVLQAWNKYSIAACMFGNAEAEAKALEYFNKWQAGENIPADIKQAALSVGLKQKSDPEIFKKIFDLYVNTKSPCEKDYLAWVLASSGDKTQLTQFLNHIIANPADVASSDFYKNIFQAMTVTSIGNDALSEFLSASFTKIMGQIPNGESVISSMFSELIHTALDDQQINKIKAIKDTYKMSSELKSKLDTTFETIVNFNVDWCAKNCKPVTDWLNAYKP